MRWGDIRWAYAAAALVVALAVLFALDLTRRRRLLDRIGDAPQLLRMAASVSPARRGLKAFLVAVGVGLLALSLARPQVEGQSQWRRRGIDVAVVLDYSKSMLARDVYPSRFERARIEADKLIDALGGDRVAVVAFAGGAIHFPLTTDYEAAKTLLRGVTPMDMPPGSDLAEAILTARCIVRPDLTDEDCRRIGGGGHGGDPLDAAEARRERDSRLEDTELGDRARAIVLLTDGEETEGEARAEVERAAQLGIQVFAVGVGRPEGDRIPELDEDGRETGWKLTPDRKSYVITRLDEPALMELARLGGGEDHYYRADPARIGQEGLVRALGELKEGDLEQRVIKNYGEAFQWLLFPAFLALLVEACIPERRRAPRRRERRT